MFSVQHMVWLSICGVLIVFVTAFLLKRRPEMNTVLNVACALCVLSELVKIFSAIEMVPSTSGSKLYPYIEIQHLPMHLCSLQILLIYFARFTKNQRMRETVLAFMYPAGVVGAAFALAIPTILKKAVKVSQAFCDPWAYQFFLFHSMLVILGLYIAFSGKVNLRPKHYFTSVGMLGVLAVLSLYANSLFAVPSYKNGKLVSVDYTTNFFFTYRPPINIPLTEKWHWYLYLAVIASLAFVLIALCYLPVFIRCRREKKNNRGELPLKPFMP